MIHSLAAAAAKRRKTPCLTMGILFVPTIWLCMLQAMKPAVMKSLARAMMTARAMGKVWERYARSAVRIKLLLSSSSDDVVVPAGRGGGGGGAARPRIRRKKAAAISRMHTSDTDDDEGASSAEGDSDVDDVSDDDMGASYAEEDSGEDDMSDDDVDLEMVVQSSKAKRHTATRSQCTYCRLTCLQARAALQTPLQR